MTSPRHQCLTFLGSHVPDWINQLSRLSEGTEERQLDIQPLPVFAPRPHLNRQNQTADTLPRPPPLHLSQAEEVDGDETPTSTKRKRRSSSLESQQNSGSNRYRTQNAKVVVYDASAQKVLEKIVDDIAQAKNCVRKAKAQARMHSLCRRSTSGSDEDEDEDDLDDDTVMTSVRLRRRKTNEGNASSDEGSTTLDLAGLDKLDKRLVKIQDYCVSAAFQLLRDGDCEADTSAAIEQLEVVLNQVADEVAHVEERSLAGSFGGSVGSASSPLMMPMHLTENFIARQAVCT